jgi:hypothetical protein
MDESLISVSNSDNAKRQQFHKLLGGLLINITNMAFDNRDLYIDGYRFINCSFTNCRIHILRGTFEFHNCAMGNSTRIFSEEAQKTSQFLVFNTSSIPLTTIPQGLRPVFNLDGTFSIAKGVSC